MSNMHRVAELSERIRRNMTEFERQLAILDASLRVTAALAAGVKLPVSVLAVTAMKHAQAFERSTLALQRGGRRRRTK